MSVVSVLGKLTFGMETFVQQVPYQGIETVIIFTFPGDNMEEEALEMESLCHQMNVLQDKTKFLTTRSLAVALRGPAVVVIGYSFPPNSKDNLTAMKRFLKSVLLELKRTKEKPVLVFRDEIRGIVYGSLSVMLMSFDEISYHTKVVSVSASVYCGIRMFGQDKPNAVLWPSLNEDTVIQDGINAEKFDQFPKDTTGGHSKAIMEGKAVTLAVKVLVAISEEDSDDTILEKLKIIGRIPTGREATELDISGGISFLPVAENKIPDDGSIRAAIQGIHEHTRDCLSLIDM